MMGVNNANQCPQGDIMRVVHVILGVFDGVHRGHRALIRASVKRAQALHQDVVAFTFHPHPKCVLSPDAPPLIYSLEQRCLLLRQAGCDRVWVQRFTTHEAQWSPQEFLAYLERIFPNLAAVSVGADFRFGHHRCGDVSTLRAWCEQYPKRHLQVGALVTDAVERISSTRIREALRCGQLAEANRLLGMPYHLFGQIGSGHAAAYDCGANVAERMPAGGCFHLPLEDEWIAQWYQAITVGGQVIQASVEDAICKILPTNHPLQDEAGMVRTEFCSWQPCLLKDGSYRCRLRQAEGAQACCVQVVGHRIWLQTPLRLSPGTHVLLFEGS